MGRPGPWLFSAYVALILLTNSSPGPGVCGTKRDTSYPPFLNQDFGNFWGDGGAWVAGAQVGVVPNVAYPFDR